MTDKAPKPPKRPKDTNQLAKRVVELATGEFGDVAAPEHTDGKDASAVSLGRRGGLKGGKARAESLSPQQRSDIARKAAQARYGKKP